MRCVDSVHGLASAPSDNALVRKRTLTFCFGAAAPACLPPDSENQFHHPSEKKQRLHYASIESRPAGIVALTMSVFLVALAALLTAQPAAAADLHRSHPPPARVRVVSPRPCRTPITMQRGRP